MKMEAIGPQLVLNAFGSANGRYNATPRSSINVDYKKGLHKYFLASPYPVSGSTTALVDLGGARPPL